MSTFSSDSDNHAASPPLNRAATNAGNTYTHIYIYIYTCYIYIYIYTLIYFLLGRGLYDLHIPILPCIVTRLRSWIGPTNGTFFTNEDVTASTIYSFTIFQTGIHHVLDVMRKEYAYSFIEMDIGKPIKTISIAVYILYMF